MTEKDARIGRKIMVDELNTINEYESMAENADDPQVAKVVRDIADEEKVHTGEGAAIVNENDPRAKPAMLEGVKETQHIEESAKQMKFNPMTGNLTDGSKPSKLMQSLGEVQFTNPRFTPFEKEQRTNTAKEIDRKNLSDKDYESKWRETKSGRHIGKSFHEVFSEKRGAVIAKANGVHIEKDANWKHAGPEAVDYVEQKKMPNTEFLRMTDHPMESIENYRAAKGPIKEHILLNKPRNAIYGAKYSPNDKTDSEWQEYVADETNGQDPVDTGEIYTVHPDSRVLVIHNPQEYKDMVEKYKLYEPFHGEDLDKIATYFSDQDKQNGSIFSAADLKDFWENHFSMNRPSYDKIRQDYDHIYFPRPRWPEIEAMGQGDDDDTDGIHDLSTNSLITLNDYLVDGKTPTRILQRPYTPRDERIAQGQQDDSRKDYVPEKDVSLGFMAEGGREPSSSGSNRRSVKDREKSKTDTEKKAPKIRHSDAKEAQGLIDREGKGGSKGKKDEKPKEETPKRDPTKPEPGRTKEYGSRNEIREEKIRTTQDKVMDRKLKQADKKPEKEVDTVDAGAEGTSGDLTPSYVQNYIRQAKKLDKKRSKKVKKARNPQRETANKLADQRTKETRGLPLAQKVGNDTRDAGAMNAPTYALTTYPGIQLVDDPADLEVNAYDRHNTPVKDRLPTGEGIFSDQNWKTIGGTFQVRPIYVNAKDAMGNIIYKVKKVPKYVRDENGKIMYKEVQDLDAQGNRVGETRWVPVVMKDALGNEMFDEVKEPKKELLYNLVLTKGGKNRAAPQKLIGRIRTKWNPNIKQWVPVGMEDLTDEDDIKDSVFGIETFANQPLWNKQEGYAQPLESQYGGENLFELPGGNDMSLPPIFQTMRGMAGIREMENSGMEQLIWNQYMTNAKIDLWDELYGQMGSGGIERGWNDLTPEERMDFENKAFELAKERRAKDEVANNEAIDLRLANDTKHQIYREKAKRLARAKYQEWADKHPEMEIVPGKDGFPFSVKYTRIVPVNGGRMKAHKVEIPYDQFIKWKDMTYEAYLEQVRIDAYQDNKAEMEAEEKRIKQNLDNRSALYRAVIADTVAKYRQKNGLDDWADIPMEELARSVSAAINKLSDEEVAQHPAVVSYNEERQNVNAEAERQNRAIYHDDKMLNREFSNNRINADKIYNRTDAGQDYLKRIGEQVQGFNDKTNENWQNVILYNAIQEMLNDRMSGDTDYQGVNEIINALKRGNASIEMDEEGNPYLFYGANASGKSKVSSDDARGIVDRTLAHLTSDTSPKMDSRWTDMSDLRKVYDYAIQNGIDPSVMLRTALGKGNDVRRMTSDENIPMDTILSLGDIVRGYGIPTTVSDEEIKDWILNESHSGQAKEELRMIKERIAKDVEQKLRQKAIATFQEKYGKDKMPTERALRKYLDEAMDRNKGPRRGMTRLQVAIENAARAELENILHDKAYSTIIRGRLAANSLDTAPEVEERRQVINDNIIAEREKPWKDAKEGDGFYATMIDDLVGRGMSPEEAETKVRQKFEGNKGAIPKKPTSVTPAGRKKEAEVNTPSQKKEDVPVKEVAVATEGDAPAKANEDTSLENVKTLTPEVPKATPKSRGGVAGGMDYTAGKNPGYDPYAEFESEFSQYVDLGDKKKPDETKINATSEKKPSKKKTPEKKSTEKKSTEKKTEHKEKSIPSFRDVFSEERGKVLRKHHGL